MLLAKTLIRQIIPGSIIYEAIDGEKAISKVMEVNPDLILMDIQMPIMNGYESTEKIRKLPNTQHIKIVALTAGTVIGEREKCLALGMNDYASKPIVKETLEKIITKWV